MNSQRWGKSKIKDWCKIKNKLKKHILPFNYMQTLYKNLHNLQVDSVEEYTKEFYQLMTCIDLNENEEQMV